MSNKFQKNKLPNMWQQISRGATLLGVFMHDYCKKINLNNQIVLDVGSGSSLNKYHTFFNEKPQKVYTVDMKNSNTEHRILDLEKDNLPFEDNFFDSVLAFNILEHIYNHNFLIKEMFRVVKKEGSLIGFVPFLVNYHPDPKDFFRYTEEALSRMFTDAGFIDINIKIIGRGPFSVNYNNIVLSIPKFLRVLILPFYLILDWIFLKLRPKAHRRYPLGYFFIAKK